MSCKWTEDADSVWETDCGEAFDFNVSGPDENGFKFCPYCGEVLKAVPFEEGET